MQAKLNSAESGGMRIRMAERIRKTEQISVSGSDGPDPKGTDANNYEPEDFAKNIGIRMMHAIAEDVKYQNILGLNVLTIKI